MIIGKIWNSPNTLVGLLFGLAGKIKAGERCKIRFGHNAIEFCGHPFMHRAAGVTLGNVICYKDSNPGECLGRHELQHTIQGEVLGPLYLPLHGLCLLIWRRLPPWENPLERGPYSNPPRPWRFRRN